MLIWSTVVSDQILDLIQSMIDAVKLFLGLVHDGFGAISLDAEDVDPTVGRFRNMVQTAVVPIKVIFSLWT